ncbi:hypothetical protein EIKCOROL_02411 [Eikenella corrodens ATCC 23834]|uniref:Uncharacterized protein n=1 Tax=Eikenella corrodens ATCC 23834 TaxID=546274 RepID=C0DYE7_EIKCO|nr:hypothetical protein [Eikenella corrodens]EEG23004.1 hypothetical protein EIKCOROL_02411 [Eikenella corrodens ATCC 23834]UAK76114.1 hypothetical protein K8P00_10770 [Eikenella corrodens]
MRTIRRQAKATSLDHAIELAKRHAKERRLPSKVMADLMGVELKTYYRWLLDDGCGLQIAAALYPARLAGAAAE